MCTALPGRSRNKNDGGHTCQADAAFWKQGRFHRHIGGDDFCIVTTPNKADEICKNCIEQFDEKVRELFTAEDVKRGIYRL
jgi:GGDEF domain-containing protein